MIGMSNNAVYGVDDDNGSGLIMGDGYVDSTQYHILYNTNRRRGWFLAGSITSVTILLFFVFVFLHILYVFICIVYRGLREFCPRYKCICCLCAAVRVYQPTGILLSDVLALFTHKIYYITTLPCVRQSRSISSLQTHVHMQYNADSLTRTTTILRKYSICIYQ